MDSYEQMSEGQRQFNAVTAEAAAIEKMMQKAIDQEAELEALGVPMPPDDLSMEEMDRRIEAAQKNFPYLRAARELRQKTLQMLDEHKAKMEKLLEAAEKPRAFTEDESSRRVIEKYRLQWLEGLHRTRTHASEAEKDLYRDLTCAVEYIPAVLRPDHQNSRERILWALGPDVESKDCWTMEDVFGALVKARQSLDDAKVSSDELKNVTDILAAMQITLNKMDSKLDTINNTTQRTDKAVSQLAETSKTS